MRMVQARSFRCRLTMVAYLSQMPRAFRQKLPPRKPAARSSRSPSEILVELSLISNKRPETTFLVLVIGCVQDVSQIPFYRLRRPVVAGDSRAPRSSSRRQSSECYRGNSEQRQGPSWQHSYVLKREPRKTPLSAPGTGIVRQLQRRCSRRYCCTRSL